MGISFQLPAVPGWLGTLPLQEDIVKCYLKKFPGASRQGSGASAIWSWNTLSLRSSRFGGTEPSQNLSSRSQGLGNGQIGASLLSLVLPAIPLLPIYCGRRFVIDFHMEVRWLISPPYERAWATSVPLITNVGTAQVGTVGS